jgi:glycosyltransferase involved in cell wall biosynthesis
VAAAYTPREQIQVYRFSPTVSIIFPLVAVFLQAFDFNEEESIGNVLDRLEGSTARRFADILVVNDASVDKTSMISKKYNVTVVSHVFNLGYGSALQLGYKYAVRRGYKYVIQIDADGQHDISNIFNLYERLKRADADGRRPDIVIGSRFLNGSVSFPVSGVKKVAIGFFRKMIKKMTGETILDPTSGLQGLNRRAFLYYSLYQNFNYSYPDANMIIQMILLGFRVTEIPSTMRERAAGVSMHAGILKPLIYMIIMPLSIISVYFRVRTGRQKAITF